ncbi:MAG: hypothetical protein OXL41_10360 [Nitrospinae bacterium]|nr:hypothetical protein [Nitrospinota bacterium]
MAVGIGELAVELRIAGDASETLDAGMNQILTRILATCEGIISDLEDRADVSIPEWAKDEATIRLASYLYDRPNAAPGAGYANVLLNSGAANVLKRFTPVSVVSLGKDQGDET